MIIKDLGVIDYEICLKKMQNFTEDRTTDTPDELWIVQHPSVLTVGIKESHQHLLNSPNHIPIIQTDRGGNITYHGLGQLVVYCLLDIKRQKISVRKLVNYLEQAVIDLLSDYQISAHRQEKMPGVYVNDQKISALGLKISHGKAYHGLSLNVDMDLTPFDYINPCGYENLKVTQISNLIHPCPTIDNIANHLLAKLSKI